MPSFKEGGWGFITFPSFPRKREKKKTQLAKYIKLFHELQIFPLADWKLNCLADRSTYPAMTQGWSQMMGRRANAWFRSLCLMIDSHTFTLAANKFANEDCLVSKPRFCTWTNDSTWPGIIFDNVGWIQVQILNSDKLHFFMSSQI